MNDHLSFEQFLALPPDEQRRVFEQQQTEAAKKRKYGLYWDDARHREDVVARCENEMPVLEEAEERRIRYAPPAADLFDTPDRPQPTHLLIEGDNYHALSVLNYTHRAKIDLIYIDPPYNTGNRDFRYNDNFVDREDGDRHTKWLSFMHRRLELAKHLLKDSGVIFISIDDNEVAQLKLLCDKVFGEGNFVALIAVVNNFKGRSDAKYIATAHESLLFYKKNEFSPLGISIPEEYIGEYKFKDSDGRFYRLLGLRKRGDNSRREDRPNLFYPIYYEEKTKKLSLSEEGMENPVIIYPKLSDGSEGNWRWGKETAKNRISELEVTLVKGRNEFDVFQKDFLETEANSLKTTKPKSFWYGSEFSSDAGTRSLRNVLGELGFNNPKSPELIKHCIAQSVSPETGIILDFFAGSGTTGHAVLEMNKEDGGRRQFILVTNNEVTDKTRRQLEAEGKSPADIEEMGICRAVTYPRLQRVVEGYVNPKGEKVAGTGGKLRYFRTDFVPAEGSSDQIYYNLRRRCTEMLCFRENVFDPLASGGQWEIFRDHDRVLAILHDEHPRHRDALRDALRALEGVSECKLYVFTLDRDVNAADYADFQNVVLENVPAKIIDLYKREVQRLSAVQAELAS